MWSGNVNVKVSPRPGFKPTHTYTLADELSSHNLILLQDLCFLQRVCLRFQFSVMLHHIDLYRVPGVSESCSVFTFKHFNGVAQLFKTLISICLLTWLNTSIFWGSPFFKWHHKMNISVTVSGLPLKWTQNSRRRFFTFFQCG